MASFIDGVLADAENPDHRRTAPARILVRQDLAAEVDRLNAELEEAVLADHEAAATAGIDHVASAPAIAQQVRDLAVAVKEHEVEFTFVSIGRRGWSDVRLANPPTDEQAAESRGLDHDPETFPVAACAASWLDPDHPGWVFALGAEYEQRLAIFQRLERTLNDTQFRILYAAALEANTGYATPKASRIAGLVLARNSPSASTAAPEESPDLSSLDGSSGQA